MILEEVVQSILAIAATALILTVFLRVTAIALKAVAESDKKTMFVSYAVLFALVFVLAVVYEVVS